MYFLYTYSSYGEMNLSFCGCGFLGIYHVGVAKALVNHAPAFLSKIDRVGGSSAGALIGAVLLCDSSKLDVSFIFLIIFLWHGLLVIFKNYINHILWVNITSH